MGSRTDGWRDDSLHDYDSARFAYIDDVTSPRTSPLRHHRLDQRGYDEYPGPRAAPRYPYTPPLAANPKAFGFSYTSGLRDLQDIKQRHMIKHDTRIHSPPKTRKELMETYTRQDSRQHPRQEFFNEWTQGGRNGSADWGQGPEARVGYGSPVHRDFRSRHDYHKEPTRPKSFYDISLPRHRSPSPTHPARPHATRPRSSSIESYWGRHTLHTKDSGELDVNDTKRANFQRQGGREYLTDHYSPRQPQPDSSVAREPWTPPREPWTPPREPWTPPREPTRKVEGPHGGRPHIPRPDYTWHKKRRSVHI